MKIGIVGTNFISDWFCEAARSVECVEVTAVYSRKLDTALAFGEKWGIKECFCDYKDMLESDIDAVYIASPTFMHESQSCMAMEYGKAVLCEKMMAASYQGALRMTEYAGKKGVVLLEAMRPAFDPLNEIIFRESRTLGTIRRAHLEYCQYSSRYDRFKRGEVLNAFNPEICNSALADIGIYPLNMALSLFGEPETTNAEAVFLENGFEAEGKISLCYPDMFCEVAYSKIKDGTAHSFIKGEKGTLYFDRVNAPTLIYKKMRGGEIEPIELDRVENNMVYELEAFRDMYLGKRENQPYLSITLATIKIVDEAYRQTGAIKYMDESLI